MKIAFSLGNLILFLITYTNCPTDKSPGTKYFRLSISWMSEFSAFSQITGSLSLNLWVILVASAFLFSTRVSLVFHKHYHITKYIPNGCSSLNCDLILILCLLVVFLISPKSFCLFAFISSGVAIDSINQQIKNAFIARMHSPAHWCGSYTYKYISLLIYITKLT